MNNRVSVIIPSRNGEKTIGMCIEAVYASDYDNFEVIVVDDGSEDRSVEIIRKFPCKLFILPHHSGASKARNTGAQKSNGQILFFIDADCMLNENTLALVNKTYNEKGPDYVTGGTYTALPYDDRFFSIFQSVFIHYSETKHAENPDYIATHALAIDARAFKKSGGFKEDFLPMIEDVEFSHRSKRNGLKLSINPDILVRHIFDFSLLSSLTNAFNKSKFWTMYSLENKDIFSDSGAASAGLKINVFAYFLMFFFLLFWFISKKTFFLIFLPVIFTANALTNRGLLIAFHRSRGIFFAVLSSIYYLLVYPVPVGLGAVAGAFGYCKKLKTLTHIIHK